MTHLSKCLTGFVAGLLLFEGFVAGQDTTESQKISTVAEKNCAYLNEAPVALQKLGKGILGWLQQHKPRGSRPDIFKDAVFVYDKIDNSIILEADVREFMLYGRKPTKGMNAPWNKQLQKEVGPDSEGIIISLYVEQVSANDVEQRLSRIYPGAYWDMYMDVIAMTNPQYSVFLKVYEFEPGSKFDLDALSKEVKRLAEGIDAQEIKGAVK